MFDSFLLSFTYSPCTYTHAHTHTRTHKHTNTHMHRYHFMTRTLTLQADLSAQLQLWNFTYSCSSSVFRGAGGLVCVIDPTEQNILTTLREWITKLRKRVDSIDIIAKVLIITKVATCHVTPGGQLDAAIEEAKLEGSKLGFEVFELGGHASDAEVDAPFVSLTRRHLAMSGVLSRQSKFSFVPGEWCGV